MHMLRRLEGTGQSHWVNSVASSGNISSGFWSVYALKPQDLAGAHYFYSNSVAANAILIHMKAWSC